MTLKQKTFSAVRWTTIAALVRGLLQIIQISILARLLMPEDYGLMAMITVILSFAVLFSDLGLNSAYVQKQNVTSQQRSSLFWASLGMNALLSILIISISPLLVIVFGDERLIPLLVLSTATFIIGALGQQIKSTAEKELNFKPIALLEISAAIIGFTATLLMASLDFGVYALVWGSIITGFTSTILAWLFISDGWRPQWRFSLIEIKPYLSFGGAMIGNNITNNINMSMDLLLGGHLLGAAQLGMYSIPRTLILQVQFMINPIITRIGFPLIAQVQNDIPRVRSIYLKTLNMTASINAPLYIGLAFFSPEIVHALLGKNWGGSIDFLRILAIWGFLRSTSNPLGSLLMGMGRANLSFKWNISLLFIVPPFLWLGSQFGMDGITWALLGLSILLFIPAWFILARPLCQAGLIEYSNAALKPALIAILAILPGYLLSLQIESPLFRLIIGTVTSVPLYLVASYALNREWLLSIRQLALRS